AADSNVFSRRQSAMNCEHYALFHRRYQFKEVRECRNGTPGLGPIDEVQQRPKPRLVSVLSGHCGYYGKRQRFADLPPHKIVEVLFEARQEVVVGNGGRVPGHDLVEKLGSTLRWHRKF